MSRYSSLEAGANGVRYAGREDTVAVNRPGAAVATLRQADTLSGGEPLPGFEMAVAEVFEG